MDELSDQKFMAWSGLCSWCEATISLGDELTNIHSSRNTPMRTFVWKRHLFLIAAYKLVENAEWAVEVGISTADAFTRLFEFKADIKILRDLNEHAIEYFRGGGLRKQHWTHISETAVSDASSTVNTRLGNRLDWLDVVEAAREIAAHLPPMPKP